MNYHELPEAETSWAFQIVGERIAWQLNEIQQFVFLCLRSIPWNLAKNPIQTQSAQYDAEPKREKTQSEMVDIMAQELSNLPRFHAYTKIIKEEGGRQTVWKGLIETNPLFPLNPNNQEKEIADISSELCTKREEIEQQIRGRQEKWRNVPQTPTQTPQQPPPTSEPPPTSD